MMLAARRMKRVASGALVLLFVSACAPQTAPTQPAPGQPVGGQFAQGAQRAAPKSLTIGVQREPSSFDPDLSGTGSGASGGGSAVRRIPWEELAAWVPGGGLEPRLAQEMPAIERGT